MGLIDEQSVVLVLRGEEAVQADAGVKGMVVVPDDYITVEGGVEAQFEGAELMALACLLEQLSADSGLGQDFGQASLKMLVVMLGIGAETEITVELRTEADLFLGRECQAAQAEALRSSAWALAPIFVSIFLIFARKGQEVV